MNEPATRGAGHVPCIVHMGTRSVENQPATFDGPPIMECLVEGVEHKAGMSSPTCPPTDDTADKGIDDKGYEARPGRGIGEIRKPAHVRRGSIEVAIDAVELGADAVIDWRDVWSLTAAASQLPTCTMTQALTALTCASQPVIFW